MPQDPIKKTLNQINDLIDFMRSGKATNEPLPADIEERIAKMHERMDQLSQMMQEGQITEKDVENALEKPQELDPSTRKLLKKSEDLKKMALSMQKQVRNLQDVLSQKREAGSEQQRQQEQKASLSRKDKKQLHLKGVRKGWTKL